MRRERWGTVKTRLAKQSMTKEDNDWRGIVAVMDGKTQALNFNCGSLAKLGCTTHSTVPFTLTTGVPDDMSVLD